MPLGLALRAIRIAKLISQRKASELSETKPSWYSQVETGKRSPSWGTLERICAALGEPMWKVLWLSTVDPKNLTEEQERFTLLYPEVVSFLRVAASGEDRLPQVHLEQLSLFSEVE